MTFFQALQHMLPGALGVLACLTTLCLGTLLFGAGMRTRSQHSLGLIALGVVLISASVYVGIAIWQLQVNS